VVRGPRQLLAGMLVLDHRVESLYWWSGARFAGRASGVPLFLLWSVVEWAAEQGRRRLNLGGSSGSETLAAFKRSLGASFETEEPQAFTREELASRFSTDKPDETLKRALDAGMLVPVEDGRYEARTPSLLDAAEGVIQQGVPLGHAVAVIAKVQDRCKSVAREFVKLFMEDVWKPFERDGYPEDRWPEVRKSIEQLRPLSSKALMAVYQMTMSDEVDSAFGKQLERLSKSKS